MPAFTRDEVDWSEAWIEGEDGARWRSAVAFGASAGADSSGCSLLEIPAGGLLPRHTDSAEETIVVVAGRATVQVGDEPPREVSAGEVALVAKDVPHQVRNSGPDHLRFAAVYAAPEVVTTYEHPVQPEGELERSSAR